MGTPSYEGKQVYMVWMFIGSFSLRVASVTGVSLSGKEEANINGDLRSESQKTQAERLIPQTEN